MVGEVKSGKSTLINALTGGEVSPVNVTEATASIIKIYHKFKEEGEIIFSDRENISAKPEEIYNILSKHRGETDFFASCEGVELGLSLDDLQKIELVDTPGLETITEANEKRTKDYLQNADVILWIFNANYLGQSDIDNSLAKVAKLGKPVIGILNRIDEIDSNVERLLNYVKRKSGLYLKEIFPLSAYKCFEAVKTKDDSKLKKWGYTDLLYYLEENIEKDSEIVQTKSIISSVAALIKKEIDLHNSFLKQLEFIEEKIKEHHSRIENYKEQINEKIKDRIHWWFESEFLKKEREKLLEAVRNNTGRVRLSILLKRSLGKRNLKRSLEEFINEIEQEVSEEWDSKIQVTKIQLEKDIEEFIKKQKSDFGRINNKDTTLNNEILKEGAKKGGMVGGSWGASLAVYNTFLSSSATYISFGSALVTMLPQALFVGAIAGMLFSYFKQGSKKENAISIINKEIEKIRGETSSKIIPKLLSELEIKNKQLAKEIYNKFINKFSNGHSKEELESLKNSIKNYINKLNNSLAEKNKISTFELEDKHSNKNEKVDFSMQVREELKNLLSEHGEITYQNNKKFQAYLMDYCGQFKKEIFILTKAVELKIPDRLLELESSNKKPISIVIGNLKRELIKNYACSNKAAEWALESWIYALNLKL